MIHSCFYNTLLTSFLINEDLAVAVRKFLSIEFEVCHNITRVRSPLKNTLIKKKKKKLDSTVVILLSVRTTKHISESM